MIATAVRARGLFALMLVGLAWFAGSSSLAAALSSKAPALALRIAPGQPSAMGQAAYDRLRTDLTPAALELSQEQATRSLKADPTNLSALTALALIAQIRGENGAAYRLMSYAAGRSRRSLPVQLWLIDFYAARGDIDKALAQIDAALLTSASAPTIIFPTLMAALDDPLIVAHLTPILVRKPLWGEQFVQHSAQNRQDVAPVIDLMLRMRRAGAPAADQALATVIDRAVDAGNTAPAFALYRAYRPSEVDRLLRNEDFSAAIPYPTAFDWQTKTGDVSATPTFDGLELSAAAGAAGVAAWQKTALTAGRYSLFGIRRGDKRGAARTEISIRCSGSPNYLAAAKPGIRLDLVVPAACPFQSVEISIDNRSSSERQSAALRRIDLLRR